MNPTTFGKIMGFANLVLALVFMGWPAGVLANHVNWWTGKTEPKGRLEQVNEEIAGPARSRDATLARWHSLYGTLDRAERQRQPRAAWYTEQLTLMRKGQWNNQ